MCFCEMAVTDDTVCTTALGDALCMGSASDRRITSTRCVSRSGGKPALVGAGFPPRWRVSRWVTLELPDAKLEAWVFVGSAALARLWPPCSEVSKPHRGARDQQRQTARRR